MKEIYNGSFIFGLSQIPIIMEMMRVVSGILKPFTEGFSHPVLNYNRGVISKLGILKSTQLFFDWHLYLQVFFLRFYSPQESIGV